MDGREQQSRPYDSRLADGPLSGKFRLIRRSPPGQAPPDAEPPKEKSLEERPAADPNSPPDQDGGVRRSARLRPPQPGPQQPQRGTPQPQPGPPQAPEPPRRSERLRPPPSVGDRPRPDVDATEGRRTALLNELTGAPTSSPPGASPRHAGSSGPPAPAREPTRPLPEGQTPLSRLPTPQGVGERTRSVTDPHTPEARSPSPPPAGERRSPVAVFDVSEPLTRPPPLLQNAELSDAPKALFTVHPQPSKGTGRSDPSATRKLDEPSVAQGEQRGRAPSPLSSSSHSHLDGDKALPARQPSPARAETQRDSGVPSEAENASHGSQHQSDQREGTPRDGTPRVSENPQVQRLASPRAVSSQSAGHEERVSALSLTHHHAENHPSPHASDTNGMRITEYSERRPLQHEQNVQEEGPRPPVLNRIGMPMGRQARTKRKEMDGRLMPGDPKKRRTDGAPEEDTQVTFDQGQSRQGPIRRLDHQHYGAWLGGWRSGLEQGKKMAPTQTHQWAADRKAWKAGQQGEMKGYWKGVQDSEGTIETVRTAALAHGKQEGLQTGQERGFKDGEGHGYGRGHADGDKKGYERGHADGDKKGYERGFAAPRRDDYERGKSIGDGLGFARGHAEGNVKGVATGRQQMLQEVSAWIPKAYATGAQQGREYGLDAGYKLALKHAKERHETEGGHLQLFKDAYAVGEDQVAERIHRQVPHQDRSYHVGFRQKHELQQEPEDGSPATQRVEWYKMSRRHAQELQDTFAAAPLHRERHAMGERHAEDVHGQVLGQTAWAGYRLGSQHTWARHEAGFPLRSYADGSGGSAGPPPTPAYPAAGGGQPDLQAMQAHWQSLLPAHLRGAPAVMAPQQGGPPQSGPEQLQSTGLRIGVQQASGEHGSRQGSRQQEHGAQHAQQMQGGPESPRQAQ